MPRIFQSAMNHHLTPTLTLAEPNDHIAGCTLVHLISMAEMFEIAFLELYEVSWLLQNSVHTLAHHQLSSFDTSRTHSSLSISSNLLSAVSFLLSLYYLRVELLKALSLQTACTALH
jgi:hypothetical protein